MRTAALCISSVVLGAGAVPPSLSALCPKPRPGEIIVCADGEPPKSPYRLPLPVERDPGDRNSISVSRERNALFDYDAGGPLSCSTAGASGASGCGFKRHKAWVEQRAGAKAKGGYLFNKPYD